jgi:hypothetical protein
VNLVIPAVSSRDPELRYQVVLSDVGDECDCPDFYWRRRPCKHIRTARQLLVEGIPGPARTHRRLSAGTAAA